jgi:hypothetical protein
MAKDRFDQFMFLSVTMSAANTLTFSEVAIGGAVFEYAGLIFTRIEYYPAADLFDDLASSTDTVDIALTGSNGLADLSVDQAQLYDRLSLNAAAFGTPANVIQHALPFVHDFSTMPGGGLMVPAQTLYIGMVTAGFGAATSASVRAYYHIEKLTAADFVELVQRYRILTT